MTDRPYHPYQLRTGTPGTDPYHPYIGTDTNTNKRSRSLGTDTEGADPYTRAHPRAPEGSPVAVLARATAFQTSGARPASEQEDWALARCLWPVLHDVEAVEQWDQRLDLLVEADLPVAIFDLAVDVLHPPAQGERSLRMPWRRAGFANRAAVQDELRRLGYRGSLSLTAAGLWVVLDALRRGLAG